MSSESLAQGELLGSEMAKVAYTGSSNLPTASEPANLAVVIERLAANPNVDVDKLERIIQLQERILRLNAEASFNEAFARMQERIPVIIEKKTGDKWKYAPLEDIVEPLRPILAEFGFSLSHETQWPDPSTVKVIGILTHKDGHSRRSEFQSAADKTGSKNSIQALGSSVSYGKRYTTSDLLCIVTRGEDNNGKDSDRGQQPDPPDGFDTFWQDIKDAAAKGVAAFDTEWAEGSVEAKNYAVKHLRDELNALKRQARDVKGQR